MRILTGNQISFPRSYYKLVSKFERPTLDFVLGAEFASVKLYNILRDSFLRIMRHYHQSVPEKLGYHS